MNVAQHVERGARLFPENPALLFENETRSYRQLHEESSRAANGFAELGIRRRDRVAIWLPNTAAFVIAYLGIHKLGAIAVTINTALKAEEIRFILNDSGARLLLTTAALYEELSRSDLPSLRQILLTEGEVEGNGGFSTLLRQASSERACLEMAPDDPAVLIYSSGTTGFPKGALLSHQNVVVSTQTVAATLGLCAEDRVLLCLSAFHNYGQIAALNPCFEAGATLLLHRQFELGPILRSIEEEQATIFFGVPTLYRLLHEQARAEPLRSVRRYISAGAPLPVTLARKWQEKYGLPINEGYGLTEVCLATFNAEPQASPGSVGKPLAGVQLNIVDEAGRPVAPGEAGEVLINSPSVLLGYWNRPEETAAVLRAGWFCTGDIGRMDAHGRLQLVDRIKDMINVGGVKVYPVEVENILYQHPGVLEVAVYGVADPILGEQVQACVVRKPEPAVTAQELISFCRQRLAEFKLPSQIKFAEQLPKNRSGKILKRLLREQASVPSRVESPSNGHPAPEQWADALTNEATAKSLLRQRLAAAPECERARLVKSIVQEQVAQLLETQEGEQESFLRLGLDSLLSIQLARRLEWAWGLSLPATLAFRYNTIDQLTDFLMEALAHSPALITDTNEQTTTPEHVGYSSQMDRAADCDWHPQLHNQQECYIWHEQIENKACMNIQQTIYIHSPVDVHALRAALQALVVRHSALRTVYTRRDGALLQRTLESKTVDFAAVDVEEGTWPTVAHVILKAAQQPFDLEQGPLLRSRLYSRGTADHLFLLVIHHIAADATAQSVIVNELWSLYQAFHSGSANTLPPVRSSWMDFVRWQTALLAGAEGERLWSYWQKQLAGDLPRLNLPIDYPRPEANRHQGQICPVEIDAELTQSLRRLAQREGCTLYMVLMAVFQSLLHIYTKQRDILVSANVSNRNDDRFTNVVGYLADLVAIRTQFPAQATFQSVLHQVRGTILAAIDHQGFPLRLLAERLQVLEHPTQPAICQVWFTLLPLRLFQESGALFQSGRAPVQIAGLTLEAANIIPPWSGAWDDLNLDLTEGETSVFGIMLYNSDLFTESTILQMIAHFKDILWMIATDVSQSVDNLKI